MLGMLALVAMTGCQDTAPNAETWTLDEVHADVGLLGGHQVLGCPDCHGQAALKAIPGDCEDCHLDDYEQASDPNHIQAGFPIECVECHTSSSWRPTSFDHAFYFPLEGAHATVVCSGCHPSDEPLGELPADCFACHKTDYRIAEPDHATLGLGTDCETCHTSVDWTSSFDHSETSYSLLGAHILTDCLLCHAPDGEAIADVPTDCYACHEADYDSATPDHDLLGLSIDCETCHTSVDWMSSFDHDNTFFPLLGAHIATDCLLCHALDGVALGELSTDCFACHEADHQNAVPDHVELAFGTACQDCHSSVDWRSDSFDHDVTDFALRGAHTDVDCLTCHTDGFVDTPSDCISCHADDEPQDHFGPDCAACHTDVAWTPSTFDHEPNFPIQRGNHREYENDCAACHFDPTDYTIFTCTDCHDGEHERRDMDDEHDDVNNYRYDSLACYDCHPNGDEDDAED